MRYIETLREGERVNEVFLCKHKQSAVTKNGKPYESLMLQDKTGLLDAKIWDPGSQGIDDFDSLDYINVVGDLTSFQGALQLNVKRVRKVQPGEYDPKDYLPVSDRDIDEMYEELTGYIAKMKNPHLKQLVSSFFLEDADFEKRFKFHSAAKSVHHGFVGGLLEHTLGVTKLCNYFADNYPILNRDLLVAAAMFHDIGKLSELSTFPENDYTDAGELEFGSPKKPALVEAVALTFADNLDAKMETMKEAFAKVPDGNTEWLGFNRLFDSNIRKTSI